MIGRGVLGNPWLIEDTVKYLEKGILPKDRTLEEKISMMKKHLDYLMEIKKEETAVKEMRTHVPHYLKGMPKNNEVNAKIFKTVSKLEFNQILDDYLKEVKSCPNYQK